MRTSTALTIAAREFKASFVTPTAYVITAGFLLLSGFFFFTLVQQFNSFLEQAAIIPDASPNLNSSVIAPFYTTLEVVLIFLIPVLAMRAISEERQNKTFELLLTSPISAQEIIVGKFLGVSAVVLSMIAMSFVFPLALITFADPEIAPIVVGFVGLVCYALGFTAISVAISSMTSSQTVAAASSMVVLLLVYVIDAPASKLGGRIGETLSYLAPSNHSEAFFDGVLDSVHLVYFCSLVLIGLFVANRVLEGERWR